jgi:serine/threonine-protein kinase SRPK3
VLHEKYVAVKVHISGLPSTSLVDLRLESLDKTTLGVEFLAIPTDYFNITGPNGTHQCIVLPLLGPPASPLLRPDLDEPHRILRKLCYQATLALRSLHHHNICHGGISSQFPIKFTDIKLITSPS